MVKLINGINVVAEAGIDGFKDISKEKVIELNPDIIIVPIAKKYDNVNKISKLFFALRCGRIPNRAFCEGNFSKI